MKKLRKYPSTTPADSFEKQLDRIDFIFREVCHYRALKAKMDQRPYLPSYLQEALEEKKQLLQLLLDEEAQDRE